ncbi:MAG: M1 family aminopeptidase [Owenweeksia sp.]|nr:M1 family aminopeptidase [Owenweeksia sp.]
MPVQDFRHGAMENTTTTIFGDFFLVDPIAFNDRNYTYVNAHELAHQWFGNLVTATGSDEHWSARGLCNLLPMAL